jgi:hypothetical protein
MSEMASMASNDVGKLTNGSQAPGDGPSCAACAHVHRGMDRIYLGCEKLVIQSVLLGLAVSLLLSPVPRLALKATFFFFLRSRRRGTARSQNGRGRARLSAKRRPTL